MHPEPPSQTAKPDSPSVATSASLFRTTRWSVVRKAQESGTEAGSEGMERLARIYWYPLYAFARRQGMKEMDAQDITQGFLARFVTGMHIQSVDASKGRFRSFLLTCFKHFICDEAEKNRARKRGGGVEFVPLDATNAEFRFKSEAAGVPEEEGYDRDWAQTLMSEVLERLRMESRRMNKETRFDVLLPFLLEDPSPGEFSQIQTQLALGESGVRSALQRLRFRFGEFLWTEIARTVSDISDVEQETRYVLAVLSRSTELQANP